LDARKIAAGAPKDIAGRRARSRSNNGGLVLIRGAAAARQRPCPTAGFVLASDDLITNTVHGRRLIPKAHVLIRHHRTSGLENISMDINHEFWARLARVHVVSHVPNADACLRLPATQQAALRAVLATTGAQALVYKRPPGTALGPEWQALDFGDYASRLSGGSVEG